MFISKPSLNWPAENGRNRQLKLIDCLIPLVIFFRLLGLELDPVGCCHLSRKNLRSIGFLLFLISGLSNIYFTGLSFDRLILMKDSITETSSPSASRMWNTIIDFGSHNILVIGVHGVLLFITGQTKWKLLWDNLQQLTKDHSHPEDLKTKCRRVVAIGIVFLILDGWWNMKRFVLSSISSKENLLTQLTDAVSLFSEIYGSAGLILFASLTWITSAYFSNLYTQMVVVVHDVNRKNNNQQSMSSQNINKRINRKYLIKWKRIHVLLLETISCINHCFGPLLLIWIIYFFINFTSSLFYLIDGIRRSADFGLQTISMWTSIVNLTRLSVNILICTKIPDILRRESIKISKPLRLMQLEEVSLQNQLDSLKFQVMQSPARITAMEFCHVNLRLIPKLVATTLTYLVILCQATPSNHLIQLN